MTRARVIPVLLLSAQGIVKTVRFGRARYLGDPINAVRIFNQKKVDELVLLDIDESSPVRPDLDRIEDIVSEAFMPVAYGGGITTIAQCAELFRRGVEKVVINSAAVDRPALIAEAAARFGSQAVVVSIDARRNLWRRPRVFTRCGRTRTKLSPEAAASMAEARGAGEILLTSIDREGSHEGYDLDLCRAVAAAVRVPVIANGGAGTLTHFREALDAGCSAVAAGSMFVFAAKGEGVLINYPDETALQAGVWSGTP